MRWRPTEVASYQTRQPLLPSAGKSKFANEYVATLRLACGRSSSVDEALLTEMGRKSHSADGVVAKLRQVDVLSHLVILRAEFWEDVMASKKTWGTISVIYDNVHMALWAMLVSFVLYFLTVVLPNIPAAQAEYQRLRIRQIAAEHDLYCNKWGMGARTQAHDQCILDMQAFRAQVEKRVYDENQF